MSKDDHLETFPPRDMHSQATARESGFGDVVQCFHRMAPTETRAFAAWPCFPLANLSSGRVPELTTQGARNPAAKELYPSLFRIPANRQPLFN